MTGKMHRANIHIENNDNTDDFRTITAIGTIGIKKEETARIGSPSMLEGKVTEHVVPIGSVLVNRIN